jgi:hypothetical protein
MRKLLIALFVSALWSAAQTTTGTVNGRVVDSSSAPIPNTPVSLTNVQTNSSVTTQTNGDGYYSFALIQPGSYRLAVEKDGFKKFATEFEIQVDQTARVDATLTVGQVSESVEVSEKSVLIEAETSSLGQVIGTKQVADLPLNGRNPFALASLSAGVWPGGSYGVGLDTTRSAAQMAGANNFMSDGGIGGSNEVLLDGVPVVVCCQGQPAIIPSVDVTQEFKVQTNASSAEFGRTSGGILNIITKSGTNAWHGSAYEFVGNDQLNAANFFTNRSGNPPFPGRDDFRTPLRNNLFGFTIGGPVTVPKLYSGKNKTFFFGGWEGTYVRQYSYVTSVTPPAAIRGGDFSSAPGLVYDPSTTVPNPASAGTYIRTPFPNNIIPASRISPIATNYLQYFPTPVIPGVVNNYNWVQGLSTNDGQGNVRVDHNFSDSSRIFARWSILSDSYHAGDWTNGITGNGQFIDAQTFVLDYVKILSPSLVLDLHYGFAFQRNRVVPDSVGTNPTTLGFPASYAAQQLVEAVPLLAISGFRTIGNDSLRNWSHYTHALSSTMSWIRGGHTLKFGWDGRLYYDNQISLDGGAGTFSYGTTFTGGPNPLSGVTGAQSTYDSFAAFLLGNPSSGSITYSDSWARHNQYDGLFVQDDWHVTPKLTLNLGVRLDIETGFVERYNRESWFNPSLPTPLAKETGLPITGGVVFPGVGGQPAALWETTHPFSPRVGVAYSITPKTVIRSAFGIFFLPTTQRGYGVSTNPGFQVSTAFLATINGVNPVGTIGNPFPSGTTPVTGSSLGPLTLVGSSVSGMNYYTPDPYNEQWNIGVQHEFPWHVLLNVAYAGSHSVKLPLNISPNNLQPQYFGTPGNQTQVSYLTQLVPNPFYNIVATGTLAASTVQRQQLLAAFPQFTSVSEQWVGEGDSFYNALQITAQKSYSQGLTIMMAYTRSKNLGNVSNQTTGFLDATGNPGFQNSYALQLEKSVLDTDVPNRFVMNSNYELPFGNGRQYAAHMNPWLNAFVGGWQANGIWTLQSGYPLVFGDSGTQAFAGSRPSFTGTAAQAVTNGSIVDRLGGISGGPGYLNATAFALPLSFQLGNVPRLTGNIRGPALHNLDFSMLKVFPIHERLRLQFRAEAFNILNQVVFSSPNATVGGASLGIIGSQANTPRNVQLALKLLW